MTDRRTRTLPDTRLDDGDTDAVAHIVPRDQQMRGYVEGKPIRALCGKVWVPTRDYQNLPVCRRCAEERDRRLAGLHRLN